MKTGRNEDKPAHIQSRRDFYDWLAQTIRIDGTTKIERDTAFDSRDLLKRRHPAFLQEPMAYADTSALYYGNPPTFDAILKEIAAWRARL